MLRIGVLFGGKSIEREVSFSSGRTVCDHLDTQLFTVVPLFLSVTNDLYILPWSFLYRGKISDFEHRLQKEAKKIGIQTNGKMSIKKFKSLFLSKNKN